MLPTPNILLGLLICIEENPKASVLWQPLSKNKTKTEKVMVFSGVCSYYPFSCLSCHES